MTMDSPVLRATRDTLVPALVALGWLVACWLTLLPAPTTAAEPIVVAEETVGDAQITERLTEIYREIEGLETVGIDVGAGVVRLTGAVSDGDLPDRADSIARRMDGVVAVENELTVTNAVVPRVSNALDTGLDRVTAALTYVPLLAVALAIVAVFVAFARFIWSRETLFRRTAGNPFIANLLRQLAGVAVVLAGLLIALELLDATAVVGAVLGAAGVAGLAIGFAFRDTIENYIAGVLLSLRQPFSPHDHVEVEGYEGHVARLTSRATVLVTLDGNNVRIPNARVFQGVLVNYSRNPLRRFEFQVGIGSDVDIAAAQAMARETLSGISGVLDDPEPLVTVSELGDSNVVLDIKAWVDQREFSFPKVRSEAIRQVKEDFDAAGFDMPEPIYRLRLSGEWPGVPGAERAGDEATLSVTPPPRADRDALREAPDVSPEHHMMEQVREEQMRVDSENLLDESAPRE